MFFTVLVDIQYINRSTLKTGRPRYEGTPPSPKSVDGISLAYGWRRDTKNISARHAFGGAGRMGIGEDLV